jgi:HD superfamily phosphohydrolase
MGKTRHEIRDPIHTFIYLSPEERRVLDSSPFQRLRNIHQLALTYLIYPGATHKRFEHSLGVMELASRVFDTITNKHNLHSGIREILQDIEDEEKLSYWRKVLRMAALCHDLGHLPFSHSAEKEILPEGWSHEKLTQEIIESEEMEEIWGDISLETEHIVKIALGQEKAQGFEFSTWEDILSEIIVGDVFGADRMDYLLRDSHHIGVAYGKFDHYRLIDTIRILPPAPSGEDDMSKEPTLGVEEGGLHSAEALSLARYFMFTQVYLHSIRRIYDIHLIDFLKEWLQGKSLIELEILMSITDNEVLSGLLKASKIETEPGNAHAKRIINREHFKKIYQNNPIDEERNRNAIDIIHQKLIEEFGESNVLKDIFSKKEEKNFFEFPVKYDDEESYSSTSVSHVLSNFPRISHGYIFVNPEMKSEAEDWLKRKKENLLSEEQ